MLLYTVLILFVGCTTTGFSCVKHIILTFYIIEKSLFAIFKGLMNPRLVTK